MAPLGVQLLPLLLLLPLLQLNYGQEMLKKKVLSGTGTGQSGTGRDCCQYYPHDYDNYWKCCQASESCNQSCDMWDIGNKGCQHKGQWYPIGAVMEIDASKCLQLRCCPYSGEGCQHPAVEVEHVGEQCRECCEHEGVLYQFKDYIYIGGCTRKRCNKGSWQETPVPAAVKQTPCPPGHIRYRDLCLVLEELWLTWDEAAELCRCKGGRLLELDGVDMPEEGTKEGEKEQQLLEQKLGNCAGSWIGSRKPGTELCGGVPPSYTWPPVLWLSCQMRLRPVCALPLKPCKEETCEVDGQVYDNNATIKTIDDCTSIVCVNGYAITQIDETCCQVEAADGIDVVPSGSTFSIGDKLCTCKSGVVDCCAEFRCELV